MIALAADKLAVDLSLWERVSAEGDDCWLRWLLLHNSGHGLMDGTPLLLAPAGNMPAAPGTLGFLFGGTPATATEKTAEASKPTFAFRGALEAIASVGGACHICSDPTPSINYALALPLNGDLVVTRFCWRSGLASQVRFRHFLHLD